MKKLALPLALLLGAFGCEEKSAETVAPTAQTQAADHRVHGGGHGHGHGHAVQRNLATFDELDFEVFSNQQWDRLGESHAQNIVVHWPDGHTTTGIQRHIEDLRALFVFAPDTKIKEHPIKFGSGEYTAVTGFMTGTFTRPMPNGDGTFTPPTGKSFRLPMCTIGRWEKGVMVEEFLYWDNQTYYKQLGLR
ncbi:ester cyclase [Hymenobacter weizhouensis]|uniref:ester cyclase n=1 Tax=Hymenobacter sp. YIM 151500-1 TaxID=2987689 RepID=UPI0022260853|nr:ester cyclase [Hymenobacter sp. YIM 151500-1]UYZ63095.1 ester cyclase [Hymenobacter sp. YIM 151500-1]